MKYLNEEEETFLLLLKTNACLTSDVAFRLCKLAIFNRPLRNFLCKLTSEEWKEGEKVLRNRSDLRIALWELSKD